MSRDDKLSESTGKDRPTVGQSFNTGAEAEKIFELWLGADGLARKQAPDFFVDYVVEIVDHGEPTGRQVAVQVKGVKLGENSATPLRFDVDGKHARYWLYDCQQPVFVFFIDVGKRTGHWLFVQEFLRENVPQAAMDRQKSIRLRFDPENDLTNRRRFFDALAAAERYVRDLHPSSVKAALAKVRCEFERKEPRLAYEIAATESVHTIFLSPKEPFTLHMTVENEHAGAAFEAWKNAVEDGAPFKMSLNHVKFTGSLLFEEMSGKPGELVLNLGRKIPGAIVLRVPTPRGEEGLQIEGMYRGGTKTAVFQGELRGAPLVVKCSLELNSQPDVIPVDLELNHPLQRWEGQPVLHLAYFELIVRAFEKLVYGGGLRADWIMNGNLLASGPLSGSPNNDTERFLKTLSWIKNCRAVAQHYRINPPFPKLATLTQEQLEAVNDLFALLTADRTVVPCPGFSARCQVSVIPGSEIQAPAFGQLRFENENLVLNVLGQPVNVGSIRTILTNVRIEPVLPSPKGHQVFFLNGNASSVRILERFAASSSS